MVEKLHPPTPKAKLKPKEDMRDEELRYPQWQGPFQVVLSEHDSSELLRKIHAAEYAIFERLQTLGQNAADQDERQAIADSLGVLHALKRDRLSFPDWHRSHLDA